MLYHLIKCDSGQLSIEAFTSDLIVSLKQWFNGLRITNWIMYRDCVLCYFHFMARMIPLSSRWRIEVVLAGKYFSFTLQSWTSECDVALSGNNKTFWPLQPIRLSNFFNSVSKIPDVIQASLLACYSTGNVFWFTCLKQRRFNGFQITNGVFLSPTIFVQRGIVSRIFAFLPPLHSWPFKCKVFSSFVWKKRPVLSMLNISHRL